MTARQGGADGTAPEADDAARKAWMSLLAKAPADRLQGLWDGLALAPQYSWLRQPEIGTTMVRGRMGGTGAAFNLGEMTVTRCSLRLEDGRVGHAYVQGRDAARACIAAQVDALMQGPERDTLEPALIRPLEEAQAAAADARATKAAATRVEFFTMVRGED